MALVKCPDCQRDVSDAAPTCPGCGRPIAGPQLRVIEVHTPSVHEVRTTEKIMFLKVAGGLLTLGGFAGCGVGHTIGGVGAFIIGLLMFMAGRAMQ